MVITVGFLFSIWNLVTGQLCIKWKILQVKIILLGNHWHNFYLLIKKKKSLYFYFPLILRILIGFYRKNHTTHCTVHITESGCWIVQMGRTLFFFCYFDIGNKMKFAAAVKFKNLSDETSQHNWHCKIIFVCF